MNFDMEGHKVNAGLGFPLIWNIQTSLGADYSHEKYPDFQGPVIRKTNRTGYTAGSPTAHREAETAKAHRG